MRPAPAAAVGKRKVEIDARRWEMDDRAFISAPSFGHAARRVHFHLLPRRHDHRVRF